MVSRWNRLGQKLERVKDPLGFDINARIRPWTVHSDLRPNKHKEDEEKKKTKKKKVRKINK